MKRISTFKAGFLLFIVTISPFVLAQKTALERIHENVRVTPYPQQEHTPYLNPPPLLVPAGMRTAELLEFELSQDKLFPEKQTTRSKAVAWCMFNPHRVLENGTWYWRFRSVDKTGTAMPWSETYSFTMTDDIPKFVTPPFETFVANLPKGYPRIYCFLEEGLKKAKTTIKSHPEYKDMTNRAKTALGDELENHPNPYTVAGKMGQMANYLYTAYRGTGDKIYADKMLAYVRSLLASEPGKPRDDFYCGDVLFLYTHVYDACYNELSPEERAEIEERTFQMAKHHHNTQRKGTVENHIFDNHYWQRAFREMLQIGLMFYETNDTAKEMLEYCYELWTARAPASGFNRDGEWHNGHGYFNANVKTLWYVPAVLSHITKTDFLQHPYYKNLGRALVYAWPPRSMSAGFGDGHETPTYSPRQRVALADYMARETGDPYAIWYCNENKNVHTDFDMRLLRLGSQDKNYPADQPLPADAPKAVWFQDVGEMVAHSDLPGYRRNLFLSFRSGPFGGGSHTLSDQNSFNLHFMGVPVYRSSGYYLNFSDPHNLLSYRHTRAHNTILVDGIGQPFSTKGYGNVVRMMTGKNISYCLGDASNAYSGLSEYPMWINNFKNSKVEQSVENGFGETPLKTYRRHLFLLHPDIVVIYDELEADKPVRWDWLLHSPVQFQIDESKKLLTTVYPEKKFTAVAQLFSNSNATITQTDKFVSPPDPKKMRKNTEYPNQWHMTAAFEKSIANRILTIIRIQPDGKSLQELKLDKNTYSVGSWKIDAQLDAAKPAQIFIRNAKNGAVFSLGDEKLTIEGTEYNREKGTSVLYDEIDGSWTNHEMSDIRPQVTGAVPANNTQSAVINKKTIVKKGAAVAKTETAKTPAKPAKEKVVQKKIVAASSSDDRFIALKTNVPFSALVIQNLALEVQVQEHITIDFPVMWSVSDIEREHALRTIALQPEARWWIKPATEGGHFVGVHAHAAWFNLKWKDNRYQSEKRPLLGAGISYGYRWLLSDHWGAEFNLGFGYANMKYNTYYNIENGARIDTRIRNYWGVTRAGLSLVYRF